MVSHISTVCKVAHYSLLTLCLQWDYLPRFPYTHPHSSLCVLLPIHDYHIASSHWISIGSAYYFPPCDSNYLQICVRSCEVQDVPLLVKGGSKVVTRSWLWICYKCNYIQRRPQVAQTLGPRYPSPIIITDCGDRGRPFWLKGLCCAHSHEEKWCPRRSSWERVGRSPVIFLKASRKWLRDELENRLQRAGCICMAELIRQEGTSHFAWLQHTAAKL